MPQQMKTPVDYSKIDSSNKDAMAALYANAHLMEVKHIDYNHFMPCYDTTYVRARSTTEFSIKNLILRSHQGTIKNLIDTYHKLYPDGANRRWV